MLRNLRLAVPTIFNDKFSPSQLTNLAAWYDASDVSTLWQDSARTTQVTSDGDVVGAWDDKSGNGYHVTQGTTAAKPLYKTGIQNSLPVIRADGTDDTLANSGVTPIGGANERTLFIVHQTSTTLDRNIMELGSSAGGIGAEYRVSPEYAIRLNGGSRVFDTAANASAFELIRVAFDGTDATGITLFIDGASVGVSSTGNVTIDTSAGIFIFATGAGTQFTPVDMCEVLVCGAITASEIVKTETYLANKWGITLS